jgi:hypothetical protein
MARHHRRSVYVVRWRTRIGIAAAAIVVGGVGLGAGLLLQGTPGPHNTRELATADSTVPTAKHDLSWCSDPAARRLDLNVGGISCEHALDVIASFSQHVAISYITGPHGYLFPDHGWTCWAKPEFKQHGGVQNFCLQNGSGIVYFQTFAQAKRSHTPDFGSTRHTARHASQDRSPVVDPTASGEPQGPLVPISEAQQQVAFPITVPDALPPDYEFSGAWLSGDAAQVRLHFAGPKGDVVLIESQSGDARPKPEGLEFETTVSGYPALGVKGDIPPQDTGPVSQLIWWTGEMYFDLYGPVSYPQIETAAASMSVQRGA